MFLNGATNKSKGVAMKTTIKDIARACGVSIGLVSRIINRDETIRCSAETKEKVLKEIERTGYSPNYYAKTLANNTIKERKDIRIGYLTYKGAEQRMANAYFDKIIESAADFEYALTSPPVPKSIPPKYRVTMTSASVTPECFIVSIIGIPAVPEGSPSSEKREHPFFRIYA